MHCAAPQPHPSLPPTRAELAGRALALTRAQGSGAEVQRGPSRAGGQASGQPGPSVGGISTHREPRGRRLHPSKHILDGTRERKGQVLPTEGAPEVVQVQGPHHGASQLPVPQVPRLVGDPRPVCLGSLCQGARGRGMLSKRLRREEKSRHPGPETPLQPSPTLSAGASLPLFIWGVWPCEHTLFLTLSWSSYATHWLPLVA